jgi:hypothetical protein
MAQPVPIRQYSGAFEAKGLTQYLGSTFPANTIMQMKSQDVMVSVNGSVMFPVKYDDESLINSTYTYKFNKDCIIALQVMVSV